MDGGLQRAADVRSAVKTPGATGQEPSLIRGLLRHRTTATTRTAQACSQTDSSRKLYYNRLPTGYGPKSFTSLKSIRLRSIVAWLGNRLFDFEALKKRAFDASTLQKGDRVVVFCCGTGYDFRYIRERIGPEGYILGVDASAAMLAAAQERIRRAQWDNVDIVRADVTRFGRKQEGRFDAGVCTLGFSIIPAYRKACDSLLSQVRNGGEIIVSDVQLTSGWRALINPLVVFWSREYGGSFAGNRNTRRLFKQLEQELSAVRKQEFFLGSYCYCIGRK